MPETLPLKGQSQLSISLRVEIAKLLALVQNYFGFKPKYWQLSDCSKNQFCILQVGIPRNPNLLTITVGLVTSRGLRVRFSRILLYCRQD